MAAVHAPQTPPASSVDRYVNPAFTTDSLEDEDSSSPMPSPSPKRYTFTPRRVGNLPRAWERKPATPFAPRTDGQRIWKRVPLGETQGNSRACTYLERHKEESLKIVKRLRTDAGLIEGQENAVYLSTKWDDAQEIIRRKVSHRCEGRTEDVEDTEISLREAVDAITPDGEPEQQGSIEKNMPEQVDDVKNRNQEQEVTTAARTMDEMMAPNNIASLEGSPRSGISDSATENEEDDVSHDKTHLQETVETIPAIKSQEPTTEVETDQIQENTDLSDIVKDIPSLTPQRATTEYKTDRILKQAEWEDTIGDILHLTQQPTPAVVNETLLEGTLPIQNQEEADLPTTEVATENSSKSQRRRSSFGTLFTGTGLILPEPGQDSVTKSTSDVPNQLTGLAHDDTAFLHDFLTRARAQKAAKASSSPEKAAAGTISPMKTSRRALAALDTNSPSPCKSDKLHLQPDEVTEDAADAKATSPCRRSNRTRLPRPQKAITAVPSNIPVRRSNGTEFVFLQRTEAQEIALATRANTKRNKGDALHPKIQLPYLNNPATIPSPSKSPRKRKGHKEVSWDEQLAHFRKTEADGLVEMEGKPEGDGVVQETSSMDSKPKARKMKRLGTVNGTPAPKRMAMEETVEESRIPARKLRSRVKS